MKSIIHTANLSLRLNSQVFERMEVYMESKTKNKKSREVIEAMVKRSFPGLGLAEGEDAIVEMKEGWFNVAYKVKLSDGRETVLKIAPPLDAEVLTYEKNIMSTEANMMKLMKKETEVRLPEVYYYDDAKDICDSAYFFMEMLTGSNFDNIKKELSEEAIKSINYQIGEITRRMNNVKGKEYFGYEGNPDLRGATWREAFLKMIDAVLEDGKRKQVELMYPYEEVRSLISQYARYLDEVRIPVFVHWDLYDPNVFAQDGNVVGILDFERALWGDPLLEAAFRFNEPKQLEGYGKTEFTPEELIRCKLYDAYLYLIMIIESFYRHYDTDWVYNFGWENLRSTLDWLKKGQE